ncbi:MAG: DoxX family protein [Alphaproteobacteria bacterium]|nr:DoxX family protein [Alphaproteobacteria bacterium]
MSIRSSHTAQNLGATGLRVTLGTILLAHGVMKVLVFTVPGTVAYFESMGLPAIAAYLTIFGEIAGGAALLAGFLTRLAAALTIPLLLGATWAHSGNGWVFSATGGGWEFPALLVALAVIVAIQGSGAYALSRWTPIQSRFPIIAVA